jgi:hypothetical protein
MHRGELVSPTAVRRLVARWRERPVSCVDDGLRLEERAELTDDGRQQVVELDGTRDLAREGVEGGGVLLAWQERGCARTCRQPGRRRDQEEQGARARPGAAPSR